MTILLPCLAVIIAALVWRASRVPIKHRWRRRQARIMCTALLSRDRNQPPALIYARLRAMDALAFEELLLESFERRGHRVTRNRCYSSDGAIDVQVVIDRPVSLDPRQTLYRRDPARARTGVRIALRREPFARPVHPYWPQRHI